MDTNSHIYKSITVKNSAQSSAREYGKLFVKAESIYTPKTNQYIEKILELISITGGVKNYDYILGWETAKVILPKICVNLRYVVKICIDYKSVNFMCGFNHYLSLNYSNFEFEIEISFYQKIHEVNLFNNPSIKYKRMILSDNSNNYDAIVSCNYSLVTELHNKGYYLLFVPIKDIKLAAMYSAFIFKNIQLIDITVLTEVFVLCNATQNKSRLKDNNIRKMPTGFNNRHDENIRIIESEININEIVKSIDERHQSLNKFDYVSIWFKNNEIFIKSDISSDDIIDFSTLDLTAIDEKQQDHYENKDNSK